MQTANCFGKRLRRFALAWWLSSIAALAGASAIAAEAPAPEERSPPACALDVATVLRSLAALPGVEARFVEERHIVLLERPLQTSGVIYYAAPDLFARHTEAPSASVLVVEARQVRLIRGDDQETIPIDVAPIVKPLLRGFLAVLQGDLDALGADYSLALQPDPDCVRWVLTLTPRAAPLQDAVARIVVEGQGALVAATELVERNGDRTRTVYTTVDPARTFTAAEKTTVFRLTPGAE